MNKRIYLLLEIKKRELDSRCYFAIKACLQGYSVIITKKESFYRNKNFLKSGYVFLKSYGPNYFGEIRKIKKLGHLICAMDEEGIMYFSAEDYKKKNIFEKNLDYIDYIFTWGNDDYKLVTNALKKFKEKIFKTGSPRIDILKKPVNGIYHEEAKEIKKQHKQFFLFNTFFTKTNHFFTTDPFGHKNNYGESLLGLGFSKDSIVYKNGVQMEKLQKDTLKEAILFVEKFAAKFKNKKLIIRPHPSENHKIWHDLSNKFENVETIYDQKSACSWILASEFAISSNCTTSVEAFILGKLNYNFKPYTNERVEFKLPKITGINVSSTEEMIKKIENFNNFNNDNDIFKKNRDKILPDLNFYFENLNENICSIENIINVIKGLEESKVKKKNDSHGGYALFLFLKTLRKLNLFRSNIKNYFINNKNKKNKKTEFAINKFPNLTVEELDAKIKNISNKMKLSVQFKITEKLPGVFLIEKRL